MTHQNNFNFLRLLFSSTVIISHSFPLTGHQEWFAEMTGGQLDLGSLSVHVFFIISGYLIFNSLTYSATAKNYIWKRLLRLYPALIVVLFFTLIIIPFIYTGDSIFAENSYYTYLPNGISLYNMQFIVKGVFENNPYPRTVNGSLWSLCYEFSMYIMILLLFPFRKNRKLSALLISSFYIFFLYGYLIGFPERIIATLKFLNLDPLLICKLGIFFTAGSILSFLRLEKINTYYIQVILLLFLLTAIYFKFYVITSFLFLPLLVILTGLSFSPLLEYIPGKIGDISYGVYIYGFVVQQVVMNYFTLPPAGLMLISLPVTYLLAYLSWHYIEAPTLRYKNYIK